MKILCSINGKDVDLIKSGIIDKKDLADDANIILKSGIDKIIAYYNIVIEYAHRDGNKVSWNEVAGDPMVMTIGESNNYSFEVRATSKNIKHPTVIVNAEVNQLNLGKGVDYPKAILKARARSRAVITLLRISGWFGHAEVEAEELKAEQQAKVLKSATVTTGQLPCSEEQWKAMSYLGLIVEGETNIDVSHDEAAKRIIEYNSRQI